MIACVVFDFDGVLVDSNEIKYQAYFDAFTGEQPNLDHIIRRVHGRADGFDRFQLIREVLREAGTSADPKIREVDQRATAIAERYRLITEEKVSQCAEIPGASHALAVLHKSLALYINSATPEDTLRQIVERRGWKHYFRDVMGGPHSKIDNLRRVIDRENVRPEQLLFIGDGRNDLAAAQAVACKFIGVSNGSRRFDVDGVVTVGDLSTLPATILDLNA